MGSAKKIPYSRVKNGNRFSEPTPRMKAAGFQSRAWGPEGREARARAWQYYEDWQDYRTGRAAPPKYTYPAGSTGEAWERMRRTEVWVQKAPATRAEWDYAWTWIEPVFGDVAPHTVTIELISELRAIVHDQVSQHGAHRVIKVWRAFWKIMAAMQLCGRDADPSLGLRNSAPKGRSATWTEGETVRLVKGAWRMGYTGLAAVVATAWDTQFAPVDVRTLTACQRRRDSHGAYFDQSRGKTGKDAIGTLSRRSERVVDAYLTALPFDVHGDAPLFRTRSGKPYSKDKLGRDFRAVREAVFPGDTRRLQDMRRSGAVEAQAGDVSAGALQQKMANSLATSKRLQDTYLPKRAATVRLADEARKRGRKRLRGNG